MQKYVGHLCRYTPINDLLGILGTLQVRAPTKAITKKNVKKLQA